MSRLNTGAVGGKNIGWGRVVFPFNSYLLVVCTVVSVVVAFVFALNIAHGEYPLSLADVWRVLSGRGSKIESKVVFELRMGRAVAAICVGAALGFSGALTQSVARNPLASPDFLGITQGASLAVVIVIGFAGLDAGRISKGADLMLSLAGIPLVAVVGAVITALCIWLIAGKSRDNTLELVLVGVGVSMFLLALTVWVMAITDLDRAANARAWLAGSLNGRDWGNAWGVLLCLLAALVGAGWLSFKLSALTLGANIAHVLGVNVSWANIAQLLVAVVLSAVAVAATGPIAFIAFVTPQLARLIGRTATPPLVLSALLGALLVSGADYVARVLLPWELPVGVVTAVCGAPILLYFVVWVNRRTV